MSHRSLCPRRLQLNSTFGRKLTPANPCQKPNQAPPMTLSGVRHHNHRLQVLCMAHPRRVAKVSSEINRQVSNMFISDPVLQTAICPERRLGASDELSAVASVTHVYVSNDLQVVKIYVSIYSDEKGKKRAMNNLKKLEPYVRREIGQRVTLRLTPEIRFEYDDSLDEMELVQKVIGEQDVTRYRRELALESGEQLEGNNQAAATDDDDGNGFFDDVDEGEYEDKEEPERISSSDIFNRPGPFDDLFTGRGDELVQARQNNKKAPRAAGSKEKQIQQ